MGLEDKSTLSKQRVDVKNDAQEDERESTTTLTGSEEDAHLAGSSQPTLQSPSRKLRSNQGEGCTNATEPGRDWILRGGVHEARDEEPSNNNNACGSTDPHPSASSSLSTATVVEVRPIRVRFNSRVRITSGIHRHGQKQRRQSDSTISSMVNTANVDPYISRGRIGCSDSAPRPRYLEPPGPHIPRSPISSRSTSPSSSISVPLRTNPDEDRDPNSIWGPLGQRVGRFAQDQSQSQQQQRGRGPGLGPRRGPEMIIPGKRPVKKRGKEIGVYMNRNGNNVGGGGGGYQSILDGDVNRLGEREGLLGRPRSYLEPDGSRNGGVHTKFNTPAGTGVRSIMNHYIVDGDLANEGLFVHEGDADDERVDGEEYDEGDEESDDGEYVENEDEMRLARELDMVFGKWPGRLLNRHWWWWHLEPIVRCTCLDESDMDQ